MRSVAVIMVVFGVTGLTALVVGFVHGRLAARRRPAVPPIQPHPLVEVLHDEDEFVAALQRAAHFEREVAERVSARAARYEALVPSSTIVALPDDRRPVAIAGPATQRRPA